MEIITPQSSAKAQQHQHLFEQGAGAVVIDGNNRAALWWAHTPELDGESIGTIGACELAENQTAVTFLSQCADILHQQYGKKIVVGPMNGNTWLKHRLILEDQGRNPFLMEPVEPEHFFDIFTAANFTTLSSYSSASINLIDKDHSKQKLKDRLTSSGIHLRAINRNRFGEDLGAIFDLSLECFSHNFLYTPISKNIFVGKYKESEAYIDPDFVLLAEHNDKLVGYVFCMPDLLAKQYHKSPALIVKTLACKPERTYAGLGTLLVSEVHQQAATKGYTEAIHALQYEKNSSHRISQRFDAKIFRRYGLMVKRFL